MPHVEHTARAVGAAITWTWKAAIEYLGGSEGGTIVEVLESGKLSVEGKA
jgi:hypothetical protein